MRRSCVCTRGFVILANRHKIQYNTQHPIESLLHYKQSWHKPPPMYERILPHADNAFNPVWITVVNRCDPCATVGKKTSATQQKTYTPNYHQFTNDRWSKPPDDLKTTSVPAACWWFDVCSAANVVLQHWFTRQGVRLNCVFQSPTRPPSTIVSSSHGRCDWNHRPKSSIIPRTHDRR